MKNKATNNVYEIIPSLRSVRFKYELLAEKFCQIQHSADGFDKEENTYRDTPRNYGRIAKKFGNRN